MPGELTFAISTLQFMNLKNITWLIVCILLLIITLYTRQAAGKARQAMEVYQQENKALLAAQTSLRQQIALLRDSDTKIVNLSDGVPKVVTKVYHNLIRQETALDISGIPTPPEGQYIQAWATVKGQPVSLGMVALSAVGSWQVLPFHADADGFIISQELMKEGNTRPIIELMNGKLAPAQ